MVRLLDDRSRRAARRAAAAVGLATAANYNGGILIVWLIAAPWARPKPAWHRRGAACIGGT